MSPQTFDETDSKSYLGSTIELPSIYYLLVLIKIFPRFENTFWLVPKALFKNKIALFLVGARKHIYNFLKNKVIKWNSMCVCISLHNILNITCITVYIYRSITNNNFFYNIIMTLWSLAANIDATMAKSVAYGDTTSSKCGRQSPNWDSFLFWPQKYFEYLRSPRMWRFPSF